MSLKTWLVLFIGSMALSAEVLLWAVTHGQFSNVNRGRWMALRRHPAPAAQPGRRAAVWWMFAGLGALAAVWLGTTGWMLYDAWKGNGG